MKEYLSKKKLDIEKQEPITYSFTKNPKIHKKYYNMRAKAFISKWNLKNFSVKEDEYDQKSDILVAMKGNECIAGARLLIHNKNSNTKLTFEVDGFDVKKEFPSLNLENKCYGEISRFALNRKYKETNVCEEILNLMALKGKEYGTNYFIVVSPLSSAKFFKKIYNNIGYNCSIYKNIPVPDRPTYENIKMHFMVIEL